MEDLRPLLFSIAYRMLGSVAEAEDVVQEAFLRRATAGAPESERAFMITVTTRLAIDVLRSARHRREAYVGLWLPEPLVEHVDPAEGEALAARFLAAARDGDLDGLVALLAADVELVGDGGGRARAIARPMRGAAAVARALVAFYGQAERWGLTLEPAWVNGAPGFRTLDAEGRLVNVVGLEIGAGAIQAVHSMLNPDKLAHLGPTSDIALRPVTPRQA